MYDYGCKLCKIVFQIVLCKMLDEQQQLGMQIDLIPIFGNEQYNLTFTRQEPTQYLSLHIKKPLQHLHLTLQSQKKPIIGRTLQQIS